MAGRKTVIIGAGVVGAALAEELSALGWDDLTVVDQGDLPATGGSSSHAPGLVFQTNSSRTMSAMATYTVEKFLGLEHEEGPCFHQVGGLELATTGERLAELHRRHGWITGNGVAASVLTPAECVELWPLLDPDTILGGLHVPTDGLAKAVRAVEAQLRLAQSRGVVLLPRTEVLDIEVADGALSGVVTDGGVIPAEVVVCCAGIWGPKVAGMVGMRLPQTPLAHQLAWTGPVPALAGQTEEILRPILRHQDADLYYRDVHDAIAIGSYAHDPMPVSSWDLLSPDEAAATTGQPSVLAFTPEDFVDQWAETRRLLPATAESEVASGINGVFSFTPDGFPLLGESREVTGFWVAEAVWVTHSAGVGRAMAEWLATGHCSSFDLHECDVHRFEEFQLDPAYVLERNCQSFVEVYDVIHPLQGVASPRPLRTSPFYPRQVELGAVFHEAAGWERPHWYAANETLLDRYDVTSPAEWGNEWAARFWSPVVDAEAQHTREHVAVYDMTALTRLEVSGPGATDFLQGLTTGDMTKSVGRSFPVTYCLLLDTDGGIRSDITVARLAENHYQVGANGHADLVWLQAHAPDDVVVRDLTPGTCCLGLWGPAARDLLQPLTDVDLTALRYFRGTRLHVGNVPVTALRLSYVGELGWELYTTAEFGLRLWDTLFEASRAGAGHDLIAAGRGAFNSLRLEKGYRSFGADMTFEHSPWEAGLGFAVKESKDAFLGREAVLARKDEVARRLVCLTLDDPRSGPVMGKEPVLVDGAVCGYVTSAAYGYTVGCGVAYAWLPAEYAATGTRLAIRYFDTDIAATVSDEPLVDPEMKRIRA